LKNIAEVKSEIAEVKSYASIVLGGIQRVNFFNLTFDFCIHPTMTPELNPSCLCLHPIKGSYEISA
jgi:hypothetical protein